MVYVTIQINRNRSRWNSWDITFARLQHFELKSVSCFSIQKRVSTWLVLFGLFGGPRIQYKSPSDLFSHFKRLSGTDRLQIHRVWYDPISGHKDKQNKNPLNWPRPHLLQWNLHLNVSNVLFILIQCAQHPVQYTHTHSDSSSIIRKLNHIKTRKNRYISSSKQSTKTSSNAPRDRL